MNPHVRKALESDIPRIIQLIRDNPDTLLPRTEDEVVQLLPHFWVSEHEGGVVGCCCLEVYSPKIAEIRSLVVDAEFRDKGHGRALVASAVEAAKARNVREILVVTSNVPFFTEQGFGPCLHEKYALFYQTMGD